MTLEKTMEKYMPTFMKMHRRAKAAVEDYNQHYNTVMTKAEGGKKKTMELLRVPTQILNLLAYPFGAIDGIIDIIDEKYVLQGLRR
ncbi:MAG TPA: hypothetical protein ENH99_02585 [Candidatus Pacearchaeota archaeon]|nr:hypothetical protein [Candidatus Pacearchaeota archaeon]